VSSQWDLLWRLAVALGLSSAIGLEREMRQIVSGIGFIGGGLNFVRRDSVRGLTTAAGVWVTAAVSIAAGFAVADLAVQHLGDRDDAVAVQLELRGPGSLTGLASELGALDGVLAVGGEDLTGAPD
jgi:uncharacterized protein (DUF697 family)